MPPLSAAKTKNDPCQTCRGDEARPICGRCKRSGDECLRAVSKLRFRHGSSARYDSDFADDQIWLSTSGNGTLEYIDETQELANYYARDTDQDVPPGLEHRSGSFGSSVDAATSARPYGTPSSRPEPSPSIQSQSSKVTVEPETWPLKRRRTNTWTSPSPHFNVYAHGSPNGQSSILLHSPTYSYHGSVTQSSSDAAYDSLLDSAKLSDGREEYQSGRHAPVNFELAPRSFPLSDQPFWPHIDVQEACLIRYFVEDLASW
ncbi:hypothetical protein MMC08_006824, partial [Hypocenomyce scalaris]|nr:hypothetical protein [Hypocenomyce scalaris]